jgi:large subunit ribosomal protein L25
MSATQAHQASQSLVSKLPLRLRNFFARYPPQVYSAMVVPPPSPPPAVEGANEDSSSLNLGSLPSPYTPSREAKGSKRPDPTAWSPSKALLCSNPKHPNPFLPKKNFCTGKWYGARIGLRQQADLVKLAKKYSVEALLPPGRKSTAYKETRRLERGLQIKGTGIGQKVKGHKWERTMETRLEERRKAMLEMPEIIRLWKQVKFYPTMLSKPLHGGVRLERNSILVTFPPRLTGFFVYREDMGEAGRSGPSGNQFVGYYSTSLNSIIICSLLSTLSHREIRFNRHKYGFRLWHKSQLHV